MLKIFGKKFPTENYPPVIIHLVYLLMAVTFCLIYNRSVIVITDLRYDEYAGICRVLDGNAIRAIQFRVLVPLIFKAFMFLHLPDRMVLIIIFIIFTYLTILFFNRTLDIYFRNRKFNYFVALVLFYSMFWNFVLLNQIYFFIDHSLLFFLTSGLYFILSRKNFGLYTTFLIGILNHPSIILLIPVFMLFNYNRLFEKNTLICSAVLIASYLVIYHVLGRIYPYFAPDKDVTIFGIFLSESITTISELPYHILLRDIFLNFGGLHIFAVLFLFSGVWKKIKLQYILIFLITVPYFLVAALRAGIRMEEMRNWIPLIPFIILPALLYLSQIKNPFLNLSDEVSKKSAS